MLFDSFDLIKKAFTLLMIATHTLTFLNPKKPYINPTYVKHCLFLFCLLSFLSPIRTLNNPRESIFTLF